MYFYLILEDAIEIHDRIVDLTKKGLGGYSRTSIGYLASALEHIQNDDFYPSFCSKLARLMFSCIKFHPFNDGNKRTSIYLGMHFLDINGYHCNSNNFAGALEDVVTQVAEGTIDKADLQVFLEQHLQSLKQDKTPVLDNGLHNKRSQDSSTQLHKEPPYTL
nr:type II toxin-antitoxin system death-on-curing family toxin [Helicobacter suis]